MAITNAQIIGNASFQLMEAGKIGTTGRTIEVITSEGETKHLPEPEPIHTFAAWRARGYSVRRGEHAIAKIQIWKHTAKMAKDEKTGEETEKTRMFMKTAAFFSASQVEPLTAQV